MVGIYPKVNIYEIIMKIQDKIENDLHETDDDLTIAFLSKSR